MTVLRSGRESSSCSSSPSRIDKKPIFKSLRSRVVYVSDPISKPRRSRPSSYFGHLERFGQAKKKTDPPKRAIVKAFNYLNQNSVTKYKLLKPGSVTPVSLPKGGIFHVNFTAKNTHLPDAPEEIFFAELACFSTTKLLFTRLCVSLGPINTISGNKLNGCRYCRRYNNVWHPKGGGFVRGGGITSYRTLQNILDIEFVDDKKHLPMYKLVSQTPEPEKESDYSLHHVNDASMYATEVVKFINQRFKRNYELVNGGFGTRVDLPNCSLFHINFKVKETEIIGPEKLFFSELTSANGVFSVKRSRILSPADLDTDLFLTCRSSHEMQREIKRMAAIIATRLTKSGIL